ncbi:hypothetical protein HpDR86_12050 [Helicobacter pylori]|uniref:hypothetical protein n=1 Tax=Helicobacter pylori TaxID=210 RepID=UPI000721617A|nr:hypothetical protein [Helicobacter pylori]ALM80780.1 hypothetical protein APV63_03625 [Helicobacter pylori]MBH0249739.1 hypothetical protein [Helicobacter pylori]OPG51990.1 hypothetical protein BGL71_05270 [Helicobacter pylori]
MLKRAKSVTDRYALSEWNDFKKHFKLSKIDKATALNKKDPKRETDLLIFHSQNPKYPLIFCPLLVYGCFNM